MQDTVSPDVARIYGAIIEELGDAFSWHLLLAHIAYMRNRPIQIKELPLPVGVTGACFAFQDTDVVVERKGLDPLRSLTTRLHEWAHLLLGHVVRQPATYADFLHTSNMDSAVYRDRITVYDIPHEAAAETLATLLLACIERNEQQRQQMVVQTVKDFWSRSGE
jgi:hypothetical protein